MVCCRGNSFTQNGAGFPARAVAYEFNPEPGGVATVNDPAQEGSVSHQIE